MPIHKIQCILIGNKVCDKLKSNLPLLGFYTFMSVISNPDNKVIPNVSFESLPEYLNLTRSVFDNYIEKLIELNLMDVSVEPATDMGPTRITYTLSGII